MGAFHRYATGALALAAAVAVTLPAVGEPLASPQCRRTLDHAEANAFDDATAQRVAEIAAATGDWLTEEVVRGALASRPTGPRPRLRLRS
jgi:hypothetical protein